MLKHRSKATARQDGAVGKLHAGTTWFLVLAVAALCLIFLFIRLAVHDSAARTWSLLHQLRSLPRQPTASFVLPKPVEQHPFVANLTQLQAAAAVIDAGMIKAAARPGQWEAHLKNPCWRQARGQVVHCLPFVLLSGFMTGIGSVIAKLKAHPNVVLDAGDAGHWGHDWSYWSEYRNSFQDTYLERIHAQGTTLAALQHDPNVSIVIDGGRSTSSFYWAGSGKMHTLFANMAVANWKVCHANFTHGPMYMQCMEDTALRLGRQADHELARRAGLDHDKDLHLPLLMRAVWSDRPPRLVLMVRDPVDRLISNYYRRKNYHERYGRNATGLERFVAEQLQGWRACLSGRTQYGRDGRSAQQGEARTAEDCYLWFESLGMTEERLFYHGDQLFRGLYAPYLRLWLRFMPADHVLVVHYEDLVARPHQLTQVVLAFLGLPLLPDSALQQRPQQAQQWQHVPVAQLGKEDAQRVMQAGAPPGDEAELGPREGRATRRTREALQEFYRPFNLELAALLHGDERVLQWSL